MRTIRQSDIEIAKAEVEILRSLGMEPEPEALLLSQLERPPAQDAVVPGPVVEINGQAVEVEPVELDARLVRESLLEHRTDPSVVGGDEIDIALLLPARDDTTMMHLRVENVHGSAQDVVGTMELAQIEERFVYSKGVRLGKHAKPDEPGPDFRVRLKPQASSSAEPDADGGGEWEKAPPKQTIEELMDLAGAHPAPSRMLFRVGRGEGTVALDAAVDPSTIRDYPTRESNAGSPEVKIAVLTQRIKDLTEHMKEHKHDYHTQRNLLAVVGRRKRMLTDLKNTDIARYRALIQRLGLRR